MSRKAITGLAGAFCAALVLVAATAESPAVIVDLGAFVSFDANGVPTVVTAHNGHIVMTNSANGTVVASATGTLPAGAALPTRAIHFNNANTGFTCLGGTDWQETVTPTGHVSLRCRS